MRLNCTLPVVEDSRSRKGKLCFCKQSKLELGWYLESVCCRRMGEGLDSCELEQVNTHLCKKRGCAGDHDWRGHCVRLCHSYRRRTGSRKVRGAEQNRDLPQRGADQAWPSGSEGGCGGRTEATVGQILELLCGIDTLSKCDEKSLDR